MDSDSHPGRLFERNEAISALVVAELDAVSKHDLIHAAGLRKELPVRYNIKNPSNFPGDSLLPGGTGHDPAAFLITCTTMLTPNTISGNCQLRPQIR